MKRLYAVAHYGLNFDSDGTIEGMDTVGFEYAETWVELMHSHTARTAFPAGAADAVGVYEITYPDDLTPERLADLLDEIEWGFNWAHPACVLLFASAGLIRYNAHQLSRNHPEFVPALKNHGGTTP